MCACVNRASTELLTHVELAVLWAPSTWARLAWEGFIQRSGQNMGWTGFEGTVRRRKAGTTSTHLFSANVQIAV